MAKNGPAGPSSSSSSAMNPFQIILLSFVHMTCTHVAVSAFSRLQQCHNNAYSYFDESCKRPLHPQSLWRNVERINCPRRCRLKCFPALSKNVEIDDAVTSNANIVSIYYKNLLSQFQGDFDNYNQVVQDRQHGLTPGEGGGHEHIHCTLVPCPEHIANLDGDDERQDQQQWVLAAFYFNGNPRQIFRFRVYQLTPPPLNEMPIRMKLYTLLDPLEKHLRKFSEQPCVWWKEAQNVWCNQNKNLLDNENNDKETWNQFRSIGVSTMVSPLLGCDVLWDPNWDPSKHSYLYNEGSDNSHRNEASLTDASASIMPVLPPGQSFHATMEAGTKGAVVDSISLIPGKRILIKDELSLWKDEFWINDRGYDPDIVLQEKVGGDIDEGDSERMPFVYGNQRGVPYKLKRVSDITVWEDPGNLEQPLETVDIGSRLTLKRVVIHPDLEWTLGEDYRALDTYREKMEAVHTEK